MSSFYLLVCFFFFCIFQLFVFVRLWLIHHHYTHVISISVNFYFHCWASKCVTLLLTMICIRFQSASNRCKTRKLHWNVPMDTQKVGYLSATVPSAMLPGTTLDNKNGYIHSFIDICCRKLLWRVRVHHQALLKVQASVIMRWYTFPAERTSAWADMVHIPIIHLTWAMYGECVFDYVCMVNACLWVASTVTPTLIRPSIVLFKWNRSSFFFKMFNIPNNIIHKKHWFGRLIRI